MSTVIRSLMVKVGADLTGMQKGLKQAAKELKLAGKDISEAGSGLTKGFTLPIIGAVAGLSGLAISAGKGADELITLANKTGLSTQTLQELEYAARFVDVEVETMTGSVQKLTKSMDMASGGTGKQAEAFAALGIKVTNADGSMRNANDVWIESIDTLGGVANETERNALAMNLFGKSAAELNPLIVAGKDELNRLKIEANEVGAVMSGENVTALGKFDDSMQKLEAQLKTAGAELGLAFLPILEKLTPIIADTIVPVLKNFSDILTNIIDGFMNMTPAQQNLVLGLLTFAVAIGPILSVVGALTTAISGIIAGFSAAAGVIAGGGGIIAALGAIIGPAGVVLLVIAAVAAAAYLIYTNWDKIKEFFTTLWGKVTTTFNTAWENIKLGTDKAIAWFTEIPGKIMAFFQELPNKFGYVIGLVLGTIIQFGINFANWVTENIPIILASILNYLADFPANFLVGLMKVIVVVATWAAEMIKTASVEVPKIVTKVIDFFKELPDKIKDVGKNIVIGLWNGINDKIKWLKDSIKGFASGILSGIKDALGIASPSKVMAEQVGKWIPAGIAKGILANKGIIQNAMSGMSGQLISTQGLGNQGQKFENLEQRQQGSVMNVNISVRSAADAARELNILSKQLATT